MDYIVQHNEDLEEAIDNLDYALSSVDIVYIKQKIRKARNILDGLGL